MMCFPSSLLIAFPKEARIVFSATRFDIGTRLSLKVKVKNVINIESNTAGKIILLFATPRLFKANNSELEDNFPYANKVAKSIDIGNDKTRKPGSFRIRTFSAT